MLLAGLGEERLEVLGDQPVEQRFLGAVPLVGAGTLAVERNLGKPHGARTERAPCRNSGLGKPHGCNVPLVAAEHFAMASAARN